MRVNNNFTVQNTNRYDAQKNNSNPSFGTLDKNCSEYIDLIQKFLSPAEQKFFKKLKEDPYFECSLLNRTRDTFYILQARPKTNVKPFLYWEAKFNLKGPKLWHGQEFMDIYDAVFYKSRKDYSKYLEKLNKKRALTPEEEKLSERFKNELRDAEVNLTAEEKLRKKNTMLSIWRLIFKQEPLPKFNPPAKNSFESSGGATQSVFIDT